MRLAGNARPCVMAKPYSTKQDMLDRWGPSEVRIVADRDKDGVLGPADDEVIAAAIADADAKIDAYVGAKYGDILVTIDDNPSELVQASCDMAMHNLSTDGGKINEVKRARHKDALDLLRDLSTGKAQLNVAAVKTEGIGVQRIGPSRTFTRSTMGGIL